MKVPMKFSMIPYGYTPETGAGEGTADNVATASTGSVTSGTASEAMIKAATAASSAEPAQSGQAAMTGVTGASSGDTQIPAGQGQTGATAAAITQTGTEGQATQTQAANRGPIPFDRHEAAIRNARTEVETRFSWAKPLVEAGIKPEALPQVVNLALHFLRDPRGFHEQLGADLAAEGGAAEKEEAFPEPDLVSADGKHKAYSADAMRKILEVQQKNLLRSFRGELTPLMETHELQQESQRRMELTKQATNILTEAQALPHFKENQSLITQKLEAMDPQVRKANPIKALYDCYHAVLSEVVFPTAEAAATAKVRDTNLKKAAASQGVHPTQQGGSGKVPELKNVTDLTAHLERLAAAAST